MPAERFCRNCRHQEYLDGADHYVCLGHELASCREAVDADGRPVVEIERVDDRGMPGLPGHDRVVDAPEDVAETGTRRVPGPEHGVAAGDPAGEVPVAPNLDGVDYWEVLLRGAPFRESMSNGGDLSITQQNCLKGLRFTSCRK